MKKLTTEEFIKRSIEKYGDKFDYSLTSLISGSKIQLQCKQGHIFNIKPSAHLSKKSKGGCIECYRLNIYNNRKNKYTRESYIQAASLVHNNTYDYSKVIYTSLSDFIIITCKIHGDFTQKASWHLLNKSGCMECGRIRTTAARVLSPEQIENKLILFRKIHKNKYTYGDIYREKNVLWLEIICPSHGSHITRLFNHEKGHGCPKCVSVASNIQIQWLEYRTISDGFIQHIRNIGEYIIPNTKWCVDGYNSETNTIYEFQGDFWHGNPKIYDQNMINRKIGKSYGELYSNTVKKVTELKNKDYNVVEIWENDWRRAIRAVKIIQKIWRKRVKHEK